MFDDRWASAREDLVKLWLADEGDIDADWPRLERFEGAGHVVATQANWWRARPGRRTQHARVAVRPYRRRRRESGPGPLQRRDRGGDRASKGSIAASVVRGCSTAAPR